MEWSLCFTKIDIKNNEFIELYRIKSNAGEMQNHFTSLCISLPEYTGVPDCLIDILDEDDSIVDDYALSHEQALIEIEYLKKLYDE